MRILVGKIYIHTDTANSCLVGYGLSNGLGSTLDEWFTLYSLNVLIDLFCHACQKKKKDGVSDWTKHVFFYDFSFTGFRSNWAIWLPCKMQPVIGCHFILNGGLWLVWHFTPNNRHWLVRELGANTRPGLISIRPRINAHTESSYSQYILYVQGKEGSFSHFGRETVEIDGNPEQGKTNRIRVSSRSSRA